MLCTPKIDIDHLCLPRTEQIREFLQVKQTVDEEKHGLSDYIKKSKEPLLKEVSQRNFLKTTKVEAEYRKESAENTFVNRRVERKELIKKPTWSCLNQEC